MITEHSVVIDRPTHEVFAIVSNLENMSHYEAFAMAGRKTSEGPIGLGTTFEVTGRMLFWKIRTTVEIIDWQAGRHFAIKTASSPVAAQTKYVFESVKGGTRLTLVDDTQFGGLLRFLEPLVTKYSRKRFQTDMNNMKAYLESLAPQGAQ